MRFKTPRKASNRISPSAKRLAVGLVGIVLVPACSKEPTSIRESANPPATKEIDPLFLVPGYEDNIYSEYGVVIHGTNADSTIYRLYSSFPPSEFMDALDIHLRNLGWSTPKFAFLNPLLLASSAAEWTRVDPYNGEPGCLSMQKWWVRSSEVLAVAGTYWSQADVGDKWRIEITLMRSHADQSRREIEEYRRMNGELPSGETVPN